jgi:hypothetical protein
MTVNVSKPAINVREKLAELDKPTGIAGEAMLRAETPQEQQALIGVGRRNMIINGDMRVAQRGTSFSFGTGGAYCLDRMKRYNAGGTAVITQQTFTAGDTPDPKLKNYMRIVRTSPSGILYLSQKVEDVRHADGATLTFSFWAKASEPVDLPVRITQEFGSGGSSGVNSVQEINHVGTNWKRFSVTFYMASLTGKTIGSGSHFEPVFDIPAVTSTIEITGWQVEYGKVATPFEHRSYGEELALCQRYYQKSYDIDSFAGDNDGNGAIAFIPVSTQDYVNTNFPISMRASPNITVYRKNGGATNQAQRADNAAAYLDVTVADISTRGFSVTPATAVSNSHYRFHYLADAEL